MESSPRNPTAEQGVALVSVLGFSLIAMLLVSAAVSFAVRTLPQTRDHENWNAALAAAEVGVEDLRARLDANPLYWSSPDLASNLALTGWKDVPGGSSDAQYHYRIESSGVGREGHIDVISSGRVGDEVRTIEVRLRREGFLDYIYFTDFDTSDPYVLSAPHSHDGRRDDDGNLVLHTGSFRNVLDARCSVYHPDRDRDPIGSYGWQNQSDSYYLNRGGCSDIRFMTDDVLTGPVRSNDAIMIRTGGAANLPRFEGEVLTGWDGFNNTSPPNNVPSGDTGRLYIRESGYTGEPFFRDGIRSVERFSLPKTTTDLKVAASESGCLYVGPTYIRFHIESEPMMTVVSPWTDPATVDPSCGTGGPGSGINSTVPLKHGEVLYARNVEDTDNEYTSTGHPLDIDDLSHGSYWGYDNEAGDMFVHGTVEGAVTVGAANDVVLVHDLKYSELGEDSSDLVGIIAERNVSVFRPSGNWLGRNRPPFDKAHNSSSATEIPSGSTVWTNARIDAAILALNRSFGVQRYNATPALCRLTVNGAIAQRFRGPVATAGSGPCGAAGSGYVKDYVYDYRLRYLSPPHFLTPEESPWTRRLWAEHVGIPECDAATTLPLADGAEHCLPPAD